MKKYYGITYLKFLDFGIVHKFWAKFCCTRNIHLFDETLNFDSHYLVCDACQLMVNVDSIDTTYVPKDILKKIDKDAITYGQHPKT